MTVETWDRGGGHPRAPFTRFVGKTPCARCGVERQVNSSRNRNGLCRDCRDVLSTSEKEAWAA